MDRQDQSRRKLIAALTVVLPLLAGVAIAAIAHFAGHETDIAKPRSQGERQRVEAAVPAAAGSPAPRVRLREGAGGRQFDSASLDGAPYAVVFLSTRCEGIGDFLGRAAAELRHDGTGAAIIAITADPTVDSPRAVRSWLSRHHIDAADPFHYLVGDEGEVRGFWNAWGFNGPSPECAGSVPAHLVSGSDANTGVIDLEPNAPASLLTGALGESRSEAIP